MPRLRFCDLGRPGLMSRRAGCPAHQDLCAARRHLTQLHLCMHKSGTDASEGLAAVLALQPAVLSLPCSCAWSMVHAAECTAWVASRKMNTPPPAAPPRCRTGMRQRATCGGQSPLKRAGALHAPCVHRFCRSWCSSRCARCDRSFPLRLGLAAAPERKGWPSPYPHRCWPAACSTRSLRRSSGTASSSSCAHRHKSDPREALQLLALFGRLSKGLAISPRRRCWLAKSRCLQSSSGAAISCHCAPSDRSVNWCS